jgi:hypothetical protein
MISNGKGGVILSTRLRSKNNNNTVNTDVRRNIQAELLDLKLKELEKRFKKNDI